MRTVFSAAGILMITATTVFAQTAPGPARPSMPGRGPMGQEQMRGPGQGMMGRRAMAARVFRQLDLTEAQKTQIGNITAKNFAATQSVREQLRAERQSAKRPEPNTPFDEQAFRSRATKLANLRIELQVAHAKTRSEIYNVLSPEQKAKLQELRGRMRERFAQRPGRPE